MTYLFCLLLFCQSYIPHHSKRPTSQVNEGVQLTREVLKEQLPSVS